MSDNKVIILGIVIVLILGGLLGIKIVFDKPENHTVSSQSNSNSEILNNSSIENMNDQQKAEILQEGMNYAEEKAKNEQDKIKKQEEKEKVQFSISLAMLGDNSFKELTYNNLDEQLKIKFGEGNYKLSGPDSNGNFTITIGTTTYNVDKSGKIKN